MFYCREKELSDLNRRYSEGKFECAIVYGRRRVGKTALINEFCKNKPTIFFSALNATSGENLEALSGAIYEKDHKYGASAPVYKSFDDALSDITRMAEEERLIFVIDEYLYLAKAEQSISSRLQHIIDHHWQNGKLFLILCGSSMSFMENQVLGYESPLYGRRTAQYKIEALTYREITVFNPQLPCEKQALIYGVTGGIPHYINKLNVKDDVDAALLENLFSTSGYLFEEPENLLKQELREPAVYNSIISAVAGGATHSNEISTKVGLESGICSKYLKVLLDLGILKRRYRLRKSRARKRYTASEITIFGFGIGSCLKICQPLQPAGLTRSMTQRSSGIIPNTWGLYLSKCAGTIFCAMRTICQSCFRMSDNGGERMPRRKKKFRLILLVRLLRETNISSAPANTRMRKPI